MDALRSESRLGTLRLEGYRWHNVLLLFVDLAILSAALWLALGLHPLVPVDRLSEYGFWGWSRWWLLMWAIWLPVASAVDMYEPVVAGDLDRTLAFSTLALLITGLIYLLIPIISVPLIDPLWTWFAFMGVAGLALIAWHGAYAAFWAPIPLQRVALIGRPQVVEPLAVGLEALPQIEVVNIVATDCLSVVRQSRQALRGPDFDLGLDPRLDAVIVDTHLCHEPEMARLLSLWSGSGLTISSIEACYEAWLGQIPLEHLAVPAWIADVQERQLLFRAWDAVSRLLDLVCALLAMPFVVLAGLFLVLSRSDDSETLLITRTRYVGLQGKRFELLRFAPMAPTWLRGLPIAWNLLLGHITLVGPRPIAQSAWPTDRSLAALFQLRTAMRPGLLGWAQARRPRGADTHEAPAADLPYDLYYIKNRGPSSDLAVVYNPLKRSLRRLLNGARTG